MGKNSDNDNYNDDAEDPMAQGNNTKALTSEKVRSSSGTGLCIVMMMMLVRLKLA